MRGLNDQDEEILKRIAIKIIFLTLLNRPCLLQTITIFPNLKTTRFLDVQQESTLKCRMSCCFSFLVELEGKTSLYQLNELKSLNQLLLPCSASQRTFLSTLEFDFGPIILRTLLSFTLILVIQPHFRLPLITITVGYNYLHVNNE